MDYKTKEALMVLLDSSSDEDNSDFEEYFTNKLSSDDSAREEEQYANKTFMDTIDGYSEDDFKSHLKMNRATIEQLVIKYSQTDIWSSLQKGGKPKLGARKEVYLYVWYISNSITFSQLGNLFEIAKSSAWTAIKRVSNWLVSIGNEYIKWPQGDAVVENCRKFEVKTKLPGVVGVIDCTHITIAAPKQNKWHYFNGEKKYSIVLQAIVDADMKLIDIYCGEPGSLDNSSVLRRSTFYRAVQTQYDRLFPNNTFLLGDSEYAATNWLVPPYKDDGQLTDRQRSFNYLHSATMVVGQNAFRLLKGRCRRLHKFTEQRNPNSVRTIIVSACILHNLCIIKNDQYTVIDEENLAQSAEHSVSPGNS